MSLIVTGTIGIDTIEVPTGERREGLLGGSCVYFAAAAALYTPTPVRIVAAIGDDFPAPLRAQLDGLGNIDRGGLEVRPGRPSFRWGGKYRADMDHRDTLFTELGVLTDAPPTVPAAYQDSDVCFLANSHPAVQAGLLGQLKGRDGRGPRLIVADTMDLWINIAKDDLLSLLGKVDGLVLNFDEAELLTGARNPVTAGRKILGLSQGGRLRFVVVKKGEHGALLIHRSGIAALPAYPSERVIDPTGAGDSFAGGLMGWITATNPADPADLRVLQRAVAHGVVTASFTIESFSLERLGSVTPGELRSRYDSYAAMTSVGGG